MSGNACSCLLPITQPPPWICSSTGARAQPPAGDRCRARAARGRPRNGCPGSVRRAIAQRERRQQFARGACRAARRAAQAESARGSRRRDRIAALARGAPRRPRAPLGECEARPRDRHQSEAEPTRRGAQRVGRCCEGQCDEGGPEQVEQREFTGEPARQEPEHVAPAQAVCAHDCRDRPAEADDAEREEDPGRNRGTMPQCP